MITQPNPATPKLITKSFPAGSVPTSAHGGNCNLPTYTKT